MVLTSSATEILLSFPPVPDAVRGARHALRGRGLDADLDHTVALLTSEVMGNAVRHGGGDTRRASIVFHAQLADDHVRVEIVDPGAGFDPAVRHTATGFGLRLLDTLARAWGVVQDRDGCHVWFEVDRRRRRFERDSA